MQYERSTDIEKVANGVIREHLPELKSKTIIYITQDRKDDKTGNSLPQMRKKKPITGDIKVVGGLNAFLISGEERTDYDGPPSMVVVIVSRHSWEHLDSNQRKAWLHQQLVRLEYDDKTGKPSLSDFDVKAMTMTAKVYGAWSDDLKLFFSTAKQHPLFDELNTEAPPVASAPKAQPGNGVKVEKAAKDNGVTEGNGEAKPEEQQKPPGLKTLKEEVARRRGGRQSARA